MKRFTCPLCLSQYERQGECPHCDAPLALAAQRVPRGVRRNRETPPSAPVVANRYLLAVVLSLIGFFVILFWVERPGEPPAAPSGWTPTPVRSVDPPSRPAPQRFELNGPDTCPECQGDKKKVLPDGSLSDLPCDRCKGTGIIKPKPAWSEPLPPGACPACLGKGRHVARPHGGVNCPWCDNGDPRCLVCEGRGCDRCSGTGRRCPVYLRIHCLFCDGTGRQDKQGECPTCLGTGKKFEDNHPKDCMYCGSKNLCRGCGGLSRDCLYCRGTGRTCPFLLDAPCPKCRGTGRK